MDGDATISLGSKVAKSFVSQRCALVAGQTAKEVIGRVKVPNGKGGLKNYKLADLKYDIKCGYLTMSCTDSPIPTPSAGTHTSSLSSSISISPTATGDVLPARNMIQEMARVVVTPVKSTGVVTLSVKAERHADASTPDDDDDDDDDVQLVSKGKDGVRLVSKGKDLEYEDEESKEEDLSITGCADIALEEGDVQIVSDGLNALVDFPHARPNCVLHPFRSGSNIGSSIQHGSNEKYCKNCYCYVCDKLASACEQWGKHCEATHDCLSWRRERKKLRLNPKSARGSTPRCVEGAKRAGGWIAHSISCAQFLMDVQQIWPVEAPTPVGLRIAAPGLHAYQRQSLAFMLHR
jgi:hypothetical protein